MIKAYGWDPEQHLYTQLLEIFGVQRHQTFQCGKLGKKAGRPQRKCRELSATEVQCDGKLKCIESPHAASKSVPCDKHSCQRYVYRVELDQLEPKISVTLADPSSGW
jgi:DNA polymerase II large subunit